MTQPSHLEVHNHHLQLYIWKHRLSVMKCHWRANTWICRNENKYNILNLRSIVKIKSQYIFSKVNVWLDVLVVVEKKVIGNFSNMFTSFQSKLSDRYIIEPLRNRQWMSKWKIKLSVLLGFRMIFIDMQKINISNLRILKIISKNNQACI